MILDLFNYFAKFPARSGVEELFMNGKSDYSQYAILKDYISNLPADGMVPDIHHFIFGESIEKVKAVIDKVTGVFLFVDFGSINSAFQQSGSVNDRLQMAITVAAKVHAQSDLVEDSISLDLTLNLLNHIRAIMISDSRRIGWLQYLKDSHQMDPFVAPNLYSLGWTLTFDIFASDALDVKTLVNSYSHE